MSAVEQMRAAPAIRRLFAMFRPEPVARAAPVTPARPIAERHVPPSAIGRGSRSSRRHRAGITRIVVAVENDLFERIRARAVGKRVSLAAEVRHILECGIDAGSN